MSKRSDAIKSVMDVWPEATVIFGPTAKTDQYPWATEATEDQASGTKDHSNQGEVKSHRDLICLACDQWFSHPNDDLTPQTACPVCRVPTPPGVAPTVARLKARLALDAYVSGDEEQLKLEREAKRRGIEIVQSELL